MNRRWEEQEAELEHGTRLRKHRNEMSSLNEMDTAHGTGISHLPLDLMKNICACLTVEELASLFNTNNLRMQKLLTTPDCVPALSILQDHLPLKSYVKAFLRRHAQLKYVEFEKPTFGESLDGLTCLNPSSLESIVIGGASEDLASFAWREKFSHLKTLKFGLSWLTVAKELDNGEYEPSKKVTLEDFVEKLPRHLETLAFDSPFHWSSLTRLPSTLTKLTLVNPAPVTLSRITDDGPQNALVQLISRIEAQMPHLQELDMALGRLTAQHGLPSNGESSALAEGTSGVLCTKLVVLKLDLRDARPILPKKIESTSLTSLHIRGLFNTHNNLFQKLPESLLSLQIGDSFAEKEQFGLSSNFYFNRALLTVFPRTLTRLVIGDAGQRNYGLPVGGGFAGAPGGAGGGGGFPGAKKTTGAAKSAGVVKYAGPVAANKGFDPSSGFGAKAAAASSSGFGTSPSSGFGTGAPKSTGAKYFDPSSGFGAKAAAASSSSGFGTAKSSETASSGDEAATTSLPTIDPADVFLHLPRSLTHLEYDLSAPSYRWSALPRGLETLILAPHTEPTESFIIDAALPPSLTHLQMAFDGVTASSIFQLPRDITNLITKSQGTTWTVQAIQDLLRHLPLAHVELFNAIVAIEDIPETLTDVDLEKPGYMVLEEKDARRIRIQWRLEPQACLPSSVTRLKFMKKQEYNLLRAPTGLSLTNPTDIYPILSTLRHLTSLQLNLSMMRRNTSFDMRLLQNFPDLVTLDLGDYMEPIVFNFASLPRSLQVLRFKQAPHFVSEDMNTFEPNASLESIAKSPQGLIELNAPELAFSPEQALQLPRSLQQLSIEVHEWLDVHGMQLKRALPQLTWFKPCGEGLAISGALFANLTHLDRNALHAISQAEFGVPDALYFANTNDVTVQLPDSLKSISFISSAPFLKPSFKPSKAAPLEPWMPRSFDSLCLLPESSLTELALCSPVMQTIDLANVSLPRSLRFLYLAHVACTDGRPFKNLPPALEYLKLESFPLQCCDGNDVANLPKSLVHLEIPNFHIYKSHIHLFPSTLHFLSIQGGPTWTDVDAGTLLGQLQPEHGRLVIQQAQCTGRTLLLQEHSHLNVADLFHLTNQALGGRVKCHWRVANRLSLPSSITSLSLEAASAPELMEVSSLLKCVDGLTQLRSLSIKVSGLLEVVTHAECLLPNLTNLQLHVTSSPLNTEDNGNLLACDVWECLPRSLLHLQLNWHPKVGMAPPYSLIGLPPSLQTLIAPQMPLDIRCASSLPRSLHTLHISGAWDSLSKRAEPDRLLQLAPGITSLTINEKQGPLADTSNGPHHTLQPFSMVID